MRKYTGKQPINSLWQLTPKYQLGMVAQRCNSYSVWNSRNLRRYTQTAADANICMKNEVGRPYSEMPLASGHWIYRLFKSHFFEGGVHKSPYKRQMEIVEKYGSIVKSREVDQLVVHISDPADVATLFRTEPQYPTRSQPTILVELRDSYKKEAGVFFLNGEKWYKHKSALSKQMLRPPKMKDYIPRLNAIADEAIACLDKARNPPNSEKADEVVELDQELFRWSFESVADFLFDKRFGSLSDDPPEISLDFITNVGRFLHYLVPVALIPRVFFKIYKTKAYRELDAAYRKLYYYSDFLISERMERLANESANKSASGSLYSDVNGFIPYLLSNNKIQPDELESSIVDTLFAGVDTTSNTIQWLLYLLATNKEKQEILRREVDLVYVNEEPSASMLSRIPYLRACIKETLRLYPLLLSTSRILHQETVLSGYRVPAGTIVRIMHYAMGRRADLFEEPNNFIPERWIRRGRVNDMISFASVPFGHGLRMCLGRRLAELELQLLMLKVIKKYKLDYPEGEHVEQFFRGTSIPDRPLRVKFVRRQ